MDPEIGLYLFCNVILVCKRRNRTFLLPSTENTVNFEPEIFIEMFTSLYTNLKSIEVIYLF